MNRALQLEPDLAEAHVKLSAIYRLAPREEIAPLERLDPLTRGHLFHRVQAEALRELMRAWNAGGDMGAAWKAFAPALASWREHARAWAGQLAKTGDLATNLVQFCSARV